MRWPGWPAYDSAALSEAFRRAVLRLFVRRGFFDEDQAEGMLQWPHSGFHVHAGVGVSEDDRPFALRHGRCVAETAALAGRTARTAPGFAPASPLLAPSGLERRAAHVHVIPRGAGDVRDPRGGVHWVLPERVGYWEGSR